MPEPLTPDTGAILETPESRYTRLLNEVPTPTPAGVEDERDFEIDATAAAYWRKENLIGAALNRFAPKSRYGDIKGDWNPFGFFASNRKDFEDIAPYLMKGEFDEVFSEQDFRDKAEFIRRQLRDQTTIERGGAPGMVLGLGVGLADPTTLIPFVGGGSRIARAAKGAVSMAAASAVQEAGLHAMDPTRTMADTGMALGTSFVLGGGLGSLGRHFDSPDARMHPDHPENPFRDENLDKGGINESKPGQTPEEGVTTTAASVGAAARDVESYAMARPSGRAANAIQRSFERVFDATNTLVGTPLSRAFTWLPKGREALLKAIDPGGRLTRGHLRGQAQVSVEQLMAVSRQHLAGAQENLSRIWRESQLALSGDLVKTMAANAADRLRLVGDGSFNKVPLKVFNDAVVERLLARVTNDVNVGETQRAMWSTRGLTEDQVRVMESHVQRAENEAAKFWDFHKQTAIKEGLFDEKLDLGGAYGMPILYNKRAINDNPHMMRSMLAQLLADNPPDEFVEEFAKRFTKEGTPVPPVKPGEAPAAGMTPEDLKANPRLWADALLEWRGDKELTMTREAAERLDTVRKQLKAVTDEFDIINHGKKVSDKERRASTVAAIKAEARRASIDYFSQRLGTAQRRAAQAEERLATLAKNYPDLHDFAGDIVETFRQTGEPIDDAVERLAAAQPVRAAAKTEVQELESALRDLPQEVRAVSDIRTQLTEALQARKAAVAEVRAAEAELREAARNQRKAAKWMDAVTRKIAESQDDLVKAVQGPGLVEALERAKARAEDLAQVAAKAEAARREAVETWRTMRAAGAISRKELKEALRDVRGAEKLVKRLAQGKPMETYIDQTVGALRGSDRFPSGLLIDQVVESGRMKERRYKWTAAQFKALARSGLIETDLYRLMDRYHTDMASRINIQKVFGTQKMEEIEAGIRAEYDDLAEKYRTAGDEKSVKAAEGLNRMRDQNVADFRAMIDKATGRWRAGAEGDESVVYWADMLRNVSYLSKAAGFVYTAVQDVGTAILVSSKFFPQLIKQRSEYRKILQLALADERAAKIGAHGLERKPEEGRWLKTLLTSMESAMHRPSTSGFLGELADPAAIGFGDPATQGLKEQVRVGLSRMGDNVNTWTGLAAFSDLVRRTAALANMHWIMESSEGYAKLGAADKAKLASLGIGESEASTMAQLFKKHGFEHEGLRVPGASRWHEAGAAGQHAKEALETALTLTQRRASYTPGYGSVPLLMGKWYGALLFQFQSFAYQFTHSFMLAGTQRLLTTGDLSFASAMGVQLGATVLTIEMRDAMRGEANKKRTAYGYASELFARSGLGGWTSPYTDAAIKAFGPAANKALGVEMFEASSKYRNNSAVQSLMGPWLNVLETPVKALGDATNGDLERAGHRLWNLAPMHQTVNAISAISDWGQ